MSNYKIKTPHAAVLVWNYVDRVGVPSDNAYNATGISKANGVTLDSTEKESLPVIISTLSCVSISTNKAKGAPDGSFNLVLAPYKNWVSTLTAGSWCAILMSNEPITEQDIKKVNKKHLKMIGRIETVRCETTTNQDGSRNTLYYVSGIDWGHIFNSILYIDNLIAGPKDPVSQGNSAAVAIRKMLFGNDGSVKSFAVKQNLANILGVMGTNLQGFTENETLIDRLAKSIYEFKIPDEMAKYLNLRDSQGKPTSDKSVNKVLSLVTGPLKALDTYDPNVVEAEGFIDPFSLQGSHTLWQVLLENSNPAMNEMFCDMDFTKDGGLQLKIYNRIKPFLYRPLDATAGASLEIASYFKNVKYHKIDTVDVISVNAGTNWRDKFNFIEIKPQFQEFYVIANWTKQKSQRFDEQAFNREGFRPLILDTKQFPVKPGSKPKEYNIDWGQLEKWTILLREWYFGTHRMLNGTLVMHGSTDYIGVGNNIMFESKLINPTQNISKANKANKNTTWILAHVESVSHSFGVSEDGARTYRTTINFVRGLLVDDNRNIIGEGMLDQLATDLTQPQDRNRLNVIAESDTLDPDPQKVKGDNVE